MIILGILLAFAFGAFLDYLVFRANKESLTIGDYVRAAPTGGYFIIYEKNGCDFCLKDITGKIKLGSYHKNLLVKVTEEEAKGIL